MIHFFYELPFELPQEEADDEEDFQRWIQLIIASERKKEGDINYIFCNDEYLHKINVDYLQHDTLTDIITFDYGKDNLLASDIYISIERVRENAQEFGVDFSTELLRVMSHGILHLCGYKDKTPEQSQQMRQKEEEKMALFLK